MKKISIIFALALIATPSLQAFFGFGYGPGWGYGPYYGGYYGGRGAAIATGALVGAGLIGSAIAARHDRDYYDDGGTRYYYS